MQQFRPADVIEKDTRLAESLVDGDVEALDTLVRRYGRAVAAVVAIDESPDRSGRAVEAFVRVWRDRHSFAPGADFAPWIGGHAADVVDRSMAEVDTTWTVAMAIEAIEPGVRLDLRTHHIERRDLPESQDRHELRLRRRLAHLGDEDAIAAALEDPAPWVEPDEGLVGRVRARLSVDDAHRDASDPAVTSEDHSSDQAADYTEAGERPSRLSRSLRPVLLGLGGAVVVLFVAIVSLSAASGSPNPVVFTADLTPTGVILDVDGGVLTVTEGDAGLQLDLDAPTLPRRAGDQFYEGILVMQDGSEQPTGTFNEGVDVTMSSGVVIDRVVSFVVVARDTRSDSAETVLKVDVPPG